MLAQIAAERCSSHPSQRDAADTEIVEVLNLGGPNSPDSSMQSTRMSFLRIWFKSERERKRACNIVIAAINLASFGRKLPHMCCVRSNLCDTPFRAVPSARAKCNRHRRCRCCCRCCASAALFWLCVCFHMLGNKSAHVYRVNTMLHYPVIAQAHRQAAEAPTQSRHTRRAGPDRSYKKVYDASAPMCANQKYIHKRVLCM